ncbi:hypothetical protein ONS95_012340 [Cadophora gregata]|uniref:uncharacterized protein n=1 Tax=Cadophora gregata TaxID=51156 RepID=UPI0026DA92D1|nr:uncharacterized protein ONS95_012340 [Cadophora gregata]KAK0118030.1 hypothetical protein ONS95_012340 [Cadophora gregata]
MPILQYIEKFIPAYGKQGKHQLVSQGSKSVGARDHHVPSQRRVSNKHLLSTSSILFGLCLLGYTITRNPPLSRPSDIPAPPVPESISIRRLVLPPVVSEDNVGACSIINPNGTGCIPIDSELQNGNFLPDNKHVVAVVTFAGAPSAPDPAHIFTGRQIILLKVDDSTFEDGASWKCITCGVPVDNQPGRNDALDYPQAFLDGKRILAGTNIIDCGSAPLASAECTPQKVHVYPIRWNDQADGSGRGGNMRELRIHPDNIHIGFSAFDMTDGHIGQYCYFGRLEFNPSPSTGISLTPRYDVVVVTRLFDANAVSPITTHKGEITFHPEAITVGELRGFTGRGTEVTYIGYPHESSNIDVFSADLETGEVRRLTSHPEYVDPIDISPDDNWSVVMDTRGSNRQMWVSGLRGVPPITDIVTTAVVASTRNNGRRRFFSPWIIDRFGDRGEYFGQKINAGEDTTPGSGSTSDPEWNGRADPKWSNDGTMIVYNEELTVAPACGGENPLPCFESKEPGGGIQRIMLATLTQRKPLDLPPVKKHSDTIPWGVPYVPGKSQKLRSMAPQGTYKLTGKVSGSAKVNITYDALGVVVRTVALDYQNFSDDGKNFLSGTEEVTVFPNVSKSPTSLHTDWHSNLTRTGSDGRSTKVTGPEGFHLDIDIMTNIFEANGTLTTVVDGVEYKQPQNGT